MLAIKILKIITQSEIELEKKKKKESKNAVLVFNVVQAGKFQRTCTSTDNT